MKIRIKPKAFALIFFSFGLLFAFQNCSGTFKFTNMQSESSSQKSEEQGNGAGYGGKPTGEYSRYIPDWTCEGRESAKANISIGPTAFTLTENKILKCGMLTADLNLALIDSSQYQTDVIGYKEGIFEKKNSSESQTKIPDNLVEAWCREENNHQGIETITHFDRVQIPNRAVNRIYHTSMGVPVLVPDFPVSRLVSRRRVQFKNDLGFDLIVYRDRPAAVPGLFQADLKTRIAGKEEARKVSCRLGASLDPNVWPARVLADFNIRNGSLKISPDTAWLGYISNQPLGTGRLYAVQTSGANHHPASPVNAAVVNGVGDFKFTPDAQSVVYNLDFSVPFAQELYLTLLNQTGTRRLSDAISAGQQGVLPDFQFTLDGQGVLYRDSSQSVAQPTVTAAYPWLRITDLDGTTAPKPINAPFLLADSKVHNFAISRTGGRVLFLGGASYPDLFSVSSDGSNLIKITPASFFSGFLTATTANYWIPWWSPLFVPAGGNYAIFQGMRSGLAGFELFAMAIDGTNLISLGTNTTYLESSPNGEVVSLRAAAATGEVIFHNLRTNTRISVAPLTPGSFTLDSSRYLSAGPNALSVTVNNGQTLTLCSALNSPIIKMQEFPDGRIAVLSYDIQNKILTVNIAVGDNDCQYSNSIPIDLEGIGAIKLSPDTLKIMVITQLGSVNKNILYIPLNGETAYEVNAASFSAARVLDAYWLKDSKAIIFYGDQVEQTLNNAYLWTAP